MYEKQFSENSVSLAEDGGRQFESTHVLEGCVCDPPVLVLPSIVEFAESNYHVLLKLCAGSMKIKWLLHDTTVWEF